MDSWSSRGLSSVASSPSCSLSLSLPLSFPCAPQLLYSLEYLSQHYPHLTPRRSRSTKGGLNSGSAAAVWPLAIWWIKDGCKFLVMSLFWEVMLHLGWFCDWLWSIEYGGHDTVTVLGLAFEKTGSFCFLLFEVLSSQVRSLAFPLERSHGERQALKLHGKIGARASQHPSCPWPCSHSQQGTSHVSEASQMFQPYLPSKRPKWDHQKNYLAEP